MHTLSTQPINAFWIYALHMPLNTHTHTSLPPGHTHMTQNTHNSFEIQTWAHHLISNTQDNKVQTKDETISYLLWHCILVHAVLNWHTVMVFKWVLLAWTWWSPHPWSQTPDWDGSEPSPAWAERRVKMQLMEQEHQLHSLLFSLCEYTKCRI